MNESLGYLVYTLLSKPLNKRRHMYIYKRIVLSNFELKALLSMGVEEMSRFVIQR